MKLGITMEELEKIRKEEAYEDGRNAGLMEAARNLREDGISIEIIARNTGLSEDEIRVL